MTPVQLSPGRRRFVLGAFPPGSRLVRSDYFRDEYLPCPIRVEVETKAGRRIGVLRIGRTAAGVEREARLLPRLASLGLPVPRLVRGPVRDPDVGGSAMTLLSFLPGRSLQAVSTDGRRGLALACRLAIAAAARLEALTPRLQRDPAARNLPRETLAELLAATRRRRGRWSSVGAYREAAEQLRPILAAVREPLVFTNGDLQPGNFLAARGRLHGFLDFESAGFRDSLYGFAKYAVYDLHPLNRGGAIRAFLRARGRPPEAFAPRLALACLLTLEREIPVTGGGRGFQVYRRHVLGLLRRSLAAVRGLAPRAADWWLPTFELVQ